MLPIRELTLTAIVVRILLAIVLGGVIGLERGMKNRAAGLRTYMLVCMGACIVMITNLYIYQAYDTGDPVRMGAQVVSGIGCIGETVFRAGFHNVVVKLHGGNHTGKQGKTALNGIDSVKTHFLVFLHILVISKRNTLHGSKKRS